MASVAAEGVEAGEATRGEGGGSRKLLLARLAIVLIAGGAGAAWFGGLLPGAEVEAPEAAASSCQDMPCISSATSSSSLSNGTKPYSGTGPAAAAKPESSTWSGRHSREPLWAYERMNV